MEDSFGRFLDTECGTSPPRDLELELSTDEIYGLVFEDVAIEVEDEPTEVEDETEALFAFSPNEVSLNILGSGRTAKSPEPVCRVKRAN